MDELPPIDPGELEAQALAAEADPAIPSDVAPLGSLLVGPGAGDGLIGMLPEWYMPAAVGGSASGPGWRKPVSWLIVTAIVLINAAGLCVTYGTVG